VATIEATSEAKPAAKPLARRIAATWELYLFLVPALTLIIIFRYLPIYGVQIAFRDFRPYAGIWGSEWVGLAVFERMFRLPVLWTLIRNTFTLSITSLVFGFPAPIILALYLNQLRSDRSRRFLQTVTYLPYFISTVVLVGMILVFLSPRIGIYGILARALGTEPQVLMGKENLFVPIYVASDIWQRTGWNSIIYLAALSAIDPSLYEAAVIDGANRWQKIRYIDIPSLTPTMIILLILATGHLLNVGFEKVFLMQNPSTIARSEVIQTYVYKVGIVSGQYSLGSAIGLFNSIVNFTTLAAVNLIARRAGATSLW